MEQTTTCKYKMVMIIDDNEIDRYVGESVIRIHNFAEAVINVEAAKDALEYLIAHQDQPELLPQLIFLDINMPEMNGFEFLDEYEHLPDSIKTNCIVMMLTTSLHEEDKQKADTCKYVYRFLNKPLNPEKLNSMPIIIAPKK